MRDQVLDYESSYLIYGGGTSFVVNVFLFRFVSPFVSRRITKTYENLPKYEQQEWNDRFISNINAVISIIMSGYSLLFEFKAREDMVWDDRPIARTACAIIVGYMLADVFCMLIWCNTSKGELFGFILHHAATVYAYFFVVVYGILCYFAMIRLIAEASTVPVNQRWYFDAIGYPRTRVIVIVNGFLMLICFFMFRMVTMPIFWYQIWMVTGTEAALKLGNIQHIMYIPGFCMDSLNLYWFFKMCKGFVKALRGILNTDNSTREEKVKST
ncbi:TLC domain-containing protein 4-B-like [Mercenaria mercenaria]|uniref:TLC domain-containing protein 4-B-like n=1 Tax=Mercenaria mercenaria TaxID=6596 RepID=UPI00234F5D8F|nr:TLC domain-containing protein 4-B-like [Mercenaria mercenaria]